MDFILLLALAALMFAPAFLPVPIVATVVGIGLTVVFFDWHCAEPALHEARAPRRAISLVRASVALCVLAAALYTAVTVWWSVTGKAPPGEIRQTLRVALVVFEIPVLLAFLAPGVVVAVASSLPRRGGAD